MKRTRALTIPSMLQEVTKDHKLIFQKFILIDLMLSKKQKPDCLNILLKVTVLGFLLYSNA